MALVVLNDQSIGVQKASATLNLPLVENPSAYYLIYVDGKWQVRDPRQGKSFRISFDLESDFSEFKKQNINPKKDILCRALGFRGNPNFVVLDGTLGMAKDALHLLSCGATVIGVERNPVLYFLHHQAHLQSEKLKALQILKGEAIDHLNDWASKIDVLYLDPMFENTKQKSAPKKGLAFLREIASEDKDVRGVIAKAIELGVKRVVVKRPYRGEHLYGKPNNIFEGKLIRYDVYTR